MKISTRARYGLRLMVDLAMKYGKGPIYLKDVSRSQEISEKYLSQIIIPLKAAGLVKSFRGAHGGYTLAREPEKINLLEVVSTLEGTLNLVECVTNPQECSRISNCAAQDVWCQVAKAMAQTLGALTLADMVERQRALSQGTAPTYSI